MNEEEIKAAIKEAVEAAKAESKGEIEALKTKNYELKGEKIAAKKEADEAKTLADELEEAKALASNDLETIKTTLQKQFEKERTTLLKERDSDRSTLRELLITSAIQKTLVENNVPKHMYEMMTDHFAKGADIADGKAIKGDVELGEHMKSFFASDNGKNFIQAPVNSGTGATGSTTVSQPHGFTKDNFAQKTGEWMILSKTDPAAAKAIAESCGRNDLLTGL